MTYCSHRIAARDDRARGTAYIVRRRWNETAVSRRGAANNKRDDELRVAIRTIQYLAPARTVMPLW